MVTLTIDHKTVTVPEGTTILEAAHAAGIAIPTLCYALILIGIGLIFNLNKKKTDQMYAEMAAKREGK